MTHKKTDEGYPIFRSYLETENDKPYYSMNTLSFYYEDMERKQKLIEDLAKAIAGYDQTLTGNLQAIEQQVAERFEQWDEKLKTFDGSVMDLLQEWVDDGTMDHIVDSSIVDRKLEPIAAQLADKAAKEEVFLKTNGININDMDEPTRQTFLEAQGISVDYVLGENNVQPKNTTFFKVYNHFNKDSPENVADKSPDTLGDTPAKGYTYSHKIPVKNGDVVYVISPYFVPFRMSLVDVDGVRLRDVKYNSAGVVNYTGYYKYTIQTAGASSMLILFATQHLAETMVVINQEVNDLNKADYVPYDALQLKDNVRVSLSEENKTEISDMVVEKSFFENKKVGYNGDSIAAGDGFSTVESGKILPRKNTGWATVIHDNNPGILSYGYAVSGGTLAANTYATSGVAYHWICRDIVNMASDLDYIIFEGGINDSFKNVPFGVVTTGYDQPFDDTTFAGALESIFKQSQLKWQGKKIGFIIVHKSKGLSSHVKQAEYWALAKEICRKWSIPYLDLFNESGLNCLLPEINTAFFQNADQLHPNERGYREFLAPKIEAWMKTL